MSVTPFFGGLMLTVVEALGDSALKKYALGAGNAFLISGLSVYAILAGMLAWLFKSLGLAITNAYWDGLSNLMTMGLGFFVFKEVYTVKQWIGMIVVTIGIVLLG